MPESTATNAASYTTSWDTILINGGKGTRFVRIAASPAIHTHRGGTLPLTMDCQQPPATTFPATHTLALARKSCYAHSRQVP